VNRRVLAVSALCMVLAASACSSSKKTGSAASATSAAAATAAATSAATSAAATAAAAPSAGATPAGKKVKIGIVGKVRIPWFDLVEKGVTKAGQDLGVETTMILPTEADAAQQVRAVEDLIAKKVDVIGVIPNDGAALEPVLKRAQDAGIKVISQEQPGLKNSDWDVELIQDKVFGEAHAEAFAKAVGGEGKYAVFVGGLTVTLHNVWADAAVAYLKAKYPKMQQIGDRYGVSNSVEDSQKTAADVMRANPDLKGFLIFGAAGPIGAGQAVTDAGKIGKVIVVGPFIPSQGQKLMKSGAITRGFLWNPYDAGYAMVQLGNMLATGKAPVEGTNIPGLGPVKLGPEAKTLRADKMMDINPGSIDELAKLL
jgi:simple sugar transport system substrate-binding protein